MAIHAMLDLETMGARPDTTILTLGAVKFDPFSNAEPYGELYLKPDIDEQDRMGRSIDDSTLEWWGKQSADAQAEAFDPDNRVGIDSMLQQLRKWSVGVNVFWAQGSGFDYTILEDLFRQSSVPHPWSFWQVRDSRTLFAMMPTDPRKEIQTDAHNALADAYFQALCVQKTYAHFGVKR